MGQIARNLTDAVDGFFLRKRYLIHDPIHSTHGSISAYSLKQVSHPQSCRREHPI
jgi:hypothetical protein